MRRRVAALTLIVPLAVACSGSSGGKAAGRSPSASGGTCTEATAVASRQTLITTSFSPACVKIKVGASIAFVNNDSKEHTAISQRGAPESLNAQLPNQSSTTVHTFKKRGTYVIVDTTDGARMTLFVT